MSEVMLRVENLKKSFDGRVVLDGHRFAGASGRGGGGDRSVRHRANRRCCAASTCWELPDEGSITIGEVAVQAPGISRRQQYQLRAQTAMVFQQYSLFANKTALQNITEPLIRVKKMRKEEARQKAARGAEAGGAGGQGGRLSLPSVRRAAAAGGHRPRDCHRSQADAAG